MYGQLEQGTMASSGETGTGPHELYYSTNDFSAAFDDLVLHLLAGTVRKARHRVTELAAGHWRAVCYTR